MTLEQNKNLIATSNHVTRKSIAINPTTPPEILLKLARQFPQEVLDNPRFEQIFFDNPTLLKRLSKKVLLRLLKQDRVPSHFLAWAANYSEQQVLLTIAMHANTPITTLEKLSQSADLTVVEAAKLHVNWIEEINQTLEEILSKAVAIADLKRNELIEYKLFRFGLVPDFILTIYDVHSRLEIAQNHETLANVLAGLIKNSHESQEVEVKAAVAKHPNTPRKILEQLLDDESQEVYENVVNNPNTPLMIIQEFYAQKKAANNSDIPPEILGQLASSQWELIHLSLARHYNAPETILEQFAQSKNWRLRLATAFNLNTPVRILQQLSKDNYWEVRWAVAQNLTTPTNLLEQLLEDNDADVCEVAQERLSITEKTVHKNSDIILSPNLIPDDRYAVDGIERTDILSDEIGIAHKAYLRKVKVSELSDVIQNVNKNNWQFTTYLLPPNIPINILQQLADSQEISDRREVACYLQNPINILEQLATDKSKEVRENVAINPNTPVTLLEQLANDKEKSVRSAVASNPHTPIKVLSQLITIEQMTEDIVTWGMYTLEEITKQPNMPLSILERLSDSEYALIQRGVASNPKTPVEILEKMMQYPYSGAREGIAINPNTPVQILEKLLQESIEKGITGDNAAVASNPNTSATTLDRLATDKINYLTQNNFNLYHSDQILLTLEAIVTNPNTENQTLVKILEAFVNVPLNLCKKIATNPNLSVNLLEKLATDCNSSVRRGVIQNPRTPLTLLEKLVKDSDREVRRVAIQSYLNRYTEGLPLVLKIYGKSFKSNLSRFIVFLHPQTPTEVLTKYSHSLSWIERYAIAKNPKTPPEIVNKLAEDANRIVRTAARMNFKCKIE